MGSIENIENWLASQSYDYTSELKKEITTRDELTDSEIARVIKSSSKDLFAGEESRRDNYNKIVDKIDVSNVANVSSIKSQLSRAFTFEERRESRREEAETLTRSDIEFQRLQSVGSFARRYDLSYGEASRINIDSGLGLRE